MHRLLLLFLPSLLAAFLLASSTSARHAPVRIWEAKDGRPVTHGLVEVHATTQEVRALLLDFTAWPKLFSDVKWVKIKSRATTETLLEVESKVLGHSHVFKVTTTDASRIQLQVVDGHGIDVRGQFILEQTGKNLTRISGSLLVDGKGILGWFVPERTVREKRRKKLLSDLDDLRQRFRE